MNKKVYFFPKQVFFFIIYMILQFAICCPISLCYQTNCFVYIGFLLSLPWHCEKLIWHLCMSFLIGCVIDAFYNSPGLHAFSAVLLIYIRHLLLQVLPLAAREKEEYANQIDLFSSLSWQLLSLYIIFFVFLYQLTVLFFNYESMKGFLIKLPNLLIQVVACYCLIMLGNIFSFLGKNRNKAINN